VGPGGQGGEGGAGEGGEGGREEGCLGARVRFLERGHSRGAEKTTAIAVVNCCRDCAKAQVTRNPRGHAPPAREILFVMLE